MLQVYKYVLPAQVDSRRSVSSSEDAFREQSSTGGGTEARMLRHRVIYNGGRRRCYNLLLVRIMTHVMSSTYHLLYSRGNAPLPAL